MIVNGCSIKNIVAGCKINDIYFKEQMYKSFYGYIMGVMIRYITKQNDAEELVNDCFIRIFNNISSFENNGDEENYKKAFKGWIGTIASRIAIDHLRKDKKGFLTDELEKVDYQLETTFVQNRMEINEILALMEKLPQTHRLVFNLYEIEGFSHDEIAKILHIPSSSSRVFLTRAKNRLRLLYEQQFKVVS